MFALYSESNSQILFFSIKIMNNFKIRFKDVFKSNLYFSRIQWRNVKSDFIFKNKSLFTFNDTGLYTHRFDQKMNYMFRDMDKIILCKFLVFYGFPLISQWVFNISWNGFQLWDSHVNCDRILRKIVCPVLIVNMKLMTFLVAKMHTFF